MEEKEIPVSPTKVAFVDMVVLYLNITCVAYKGK